MGCLAFERDGLDEWMETLPVPFSLTSLISIPRGAEPPTKDHGQAGIISWRE